MTKAKSSTRSFLSSITLQSSVFAIKALITSFKSTILFSLPALGPFIGLNGISGAQLLRDTYRAELLSPKNS